MIRIATLPRARSALLAAALVLTTGCGVVRRIFLGGGTEPPRFYYSLQLPTESADSAAAPVDGMSGDAPLQGSLAVLPYLTPGLYGEPKLVFRTGETQYNTYPNREWAIPLNQQLGMITQSVLRSMPVTTGAALFDPPSRSAQTYIWRGAVRHLEEVDRGTDVLVAVHLDAALVRTANDSVVWSGSARGERSVGGSRDMNVVVGALSDLAAEVVGQLARDAGASLRRSAVRAQTGR